MRRRNSTFRSRRGFRGQYRSARRAMRRTFMWTVAMAMVAGYLFLPHPANRDGAGARDWFRDILNHPVPPGIADGVAGTGDTARVIDGDTLDIAGTRIRLHCIDAPESGQVCRIGSRRWNCGQEATAALRGLIAGQPASCATRDRDRYGRDIAVCNVSGADINAWMVRNGWALAYRRYSMDCVLHERWARDGRLGIWKGDFVKPWEWRRGKRL